VGFLDRFTGGPDRLRELLAAPGVVVAAGCFDPFSARVAEEAGFEVVYMTGNGTSAVRLGRPDVGLLTLPEMADQAGRIADAVEVPLIADADTGYGSPLNVIRTVRAYESAGVAALHLEDQQMPKRCGHLDGKQLVPASEHVAKIRAAVAARTDGGPLIIGRTDAVSVEGVDAAIERARAYGEAGADVLFVEGLANEADIQRTAVELDGWPLAYAWLEGRGPQVTPDRLGELGVGLVIFPLTAILSALANLRRTYEHLHEHGTAVGMLKDMASFEEFNDFMGAAQAAELDDRFSGS
jgi:2-methylisocitrate lyase-like PEP mutase family enzyme